MIIKDYVTMRQNLLRMIPPVDKLLEQDDIAALMTRYSRGLVVKAVQKRLAALRETIVTADDVTAAGAEEQHRHCAGRRD